MTLRIILGVLASLATFGLLAIMAISDQYRKSWGATPNSILVGLFPLIALVLILSSLAMPEKRNLLHAVAVLNGLGVLGSLWLCTEAPILGGACLIYLALWGLYYFQTLGANAP